MNFLEHIKLKKRLTAVLLAIAMVVTSVQAPGGVSYAAEATGSSENVADGEEQQEDSAVTVEGEVQSDESAQTSADGRTEEMTETIATETDTEDNAATQETAVKETTASTVAEEEMTETAVTEITATEEETTNEETTTETFETETIEEEETVIEAELNGAYQFGGVPEDNVITALSASAADVEAAQKHLYEKMLAREKTISLSAYSIPTSDLAALFSGVLNEHPDLYFVNKGYKVTQGAAGSVVSIEVTYSTGYDDDAFKTNTEDALACITDSMSDFQKAAVLHDYLAVNVEYDYDNLQADNVPAASFNAYGALVNGTAVCEGYALAYKYLLGKVGIESYMVTSETMNHAWNMVKLGGKYYHVDVTWDDPTRDIVGRVTHTYMFCSDTTLEKHSDWTVTSGSGTVDYKAEDTSYQNAFWRESTAPLVFDGNTCYYITSVPTRGGYLMCADFSNITDSGTEIAAIGKWSNSSGSVWTGAYSGLYMINGRLFYNDSSSIYSIGTDGEDRKTEFTANTEGGYSIFGSAYRGGKILYALHTSPNLTEKETVLTADISGVTEDEPIPPEETKTGYNLAITSELEAVIESYANSTVNVFNSDGKKVPKGDGKPVVLLFYNSSDTTTNSLSTLKSLSGHSNYFNDVEFYAVDTNFASYTSTDVTKSFVENNSLSKTLINWLQIRNAHAYMANYYTYINNAKNTSLSGKDFPLIIYIDKDNKIQYATQVSLTAEAVLTNLRQYCGYSRYCVTYHMNGGKNNSENPSTFTSSNEDIALKNPPYREGYRFSGWYKDSRFTKKMTKIPAGTKNDITLYAKWTKGAFDLANLTQEYTTLEDATVNSTADGKAKVLIFYKEGDTESTVTLGSISAELQVSNTHDLFGVDLYAIETENATKDTITSKHPDRKGITFCYNNLKKNLGNMNAYAETAGISALLNGIVYDYPVICFIDKNNRLQYVSTGSSSVTAIRENLQLYCQYPSAAYKIYYELDGGTNNSGNPSIYTEETATITLKAPTKTGFRFDGWYRDASFTQKVTEIPKGSKGNLTLYAKWQEQGSMGNGKNLENLDYTFTTIDDQKVTSQANGKPKVLLYFKTDCGNCKGTIQDLAKYIKMFSGADIYALEINSKSKSEVAEFKAQYGCDEITYCYGGLNNTSMWDYYRKVAGSSDAAVTTPVIIYISADNRLQWGTIGRQSASDVLKALQEYCGYDYYSITYELNGGTNNSENPEMYQSSTGTVLKDASKEGFTFGGWYTDAAFTQRVTEIAQGTTGDLTLYAKWTSGSGGKLDTANLDQTYKGIDTKTYSSKANGKPKLLVFFMEDHAGSQNTVKNITGVIGSLDGVDIYAIDMTQVAGDENCDAILPRITAFKQAYGCDQITFAYDDWHVPSNYDKAKAYHDAAGLSGMYLPIIAYIDKDNKLQWVSDHEQTGEQVLENLKKYCNYPQEGVYRITYELDGGTNSKDNPSTYTAETDTIVLKNATKLGCTFDGWYKDKRFLEKVTEIPKGSAGDITLYAKWRRSGLNYPNAAVDDTYTALDGTKLSPQAAKGRPKVLIFFGGNSTDDNAKNTIKSICESFGDFSDADIYAIETEKGKKDSVSAFQKACGAEKLPFAYDEDGKVNKSSMQFYERIGTGKNEATPKYPLICYIDGDNMYQLITTGASSAADVLKNLQEYCGYVSQEGVYKITYVLDGGTNHSGNPNVYTSDMETITLKDATKKGYVFDGWYKDAQFKEQVTQIVKGSTGDITLYAKWIAQGDNEAEIKITFVDKVFVYNGKTQNPKVKVTTKGANGKDITLKEGTDYKLSYKNSKNAGTATVIVTGIGEYTGTVEENFVIEPAPLIIRAADMVILVGDRIPTEYEYEVDGLQGSDTLKVLVKEPVLVCDIESTAQEGEYAVTPSGADAGKNYVITYESGTLVVTTEYVLWRVTFDTQGHGKAPADYPGVRSGDTIEAPVEPREEGYRFAGWYEDPECTIEWDFGQNIVESDITLYAKWLCVSSDDSFALQEIPDQCYTGKALKPAVSVYDGDTLLKAGKDYQLKYYNNINVNAGDVKKTGNGQGENFNESLPYVEITGKGNYKNTVKVNFNILKIYLGDGSETPAQGVVLKVNDQYSKSGSPIKPTVSLKAGKALKKNTDYLLSVEPIEAFDASGYQIVSIDKPEIPAKATGTFKLVITGTGNYEGSISDVIYVADSSYLLKNAKVTVGKNVQTMDWTGKEITIPSTTKEGNENAFIVQMEGKDKKKPTTLKKGTHYRVIPWEGSAGKAELIIEGIYPYVGRKSIPFTVKGWAFSGSNVTISGVTDKTYTGKAHTQNKEAVVTYKGAPKPLVYGADYTITYSKNINKGTATMTFIGNPKEGYTGKVKKTFKIGAVDISTVKQDASMGNIKVTYTKAGAKPVDEIILTSQTGVRLRCGKDYTLKYKDNKAVTNSAKVTVTGKGNYSGKFDVTYEIVKADLSADNIVAQPAATAFNEKKADDFAYKPAVKLKDGKASLSAGKDYKIEYLKNTQADYKNYLTKLMAGTATDEDEPRARITPIEGANYGLPGDTLAIDIPLQIYQTKLDKKKLSVQIKEAVYTGEQVTPDVTVSYDGKALKEGVDYILAYGANNKAGKNKGSVIVSGLAPYYGGSATVKFDIIEKELKY